jgi:GntR family transcriptional repressor for pyruvate dehydrogenase complex
MKNSIKTKVALPHFKRGNLVEMVFNAIRDEVLSGKFKQGEKLASQEIFCKDFGVSRTVVREAWNKLASIGLIKTIHGHGSFVNHPDASNILGPICDAIQLDKNSTQDLLESRFYLETIIVRLAAKRSTQKDIAKLSKIVELMEINAEKNNNKQTIRYDIEFHQSLADISQNMVLKRFLLTISKMIQRFLKDYTKIPGTSQNAICYHRRIIRAVAKKDPDLAEAEMKAHLEDVINTLRETLDLAIDL